MTSVFISYRREDSQGWVGRLAQTLRQDLPEVQVFYDIATIRPGEDFVVAIDEALSSCQAMLAIIGPRWLSVQTASGERRIDNTEDFVRLEIERALLNSLRIIPVLFGNAVMPKASELPESLRPLSKRQALEISDTRWDYDSNALVKFLRETLDLAPALSTDPGNAARGADITVGRGLSITGSHVGDIVGVKATGGEQLASPGSIDVASDARLQDTVAGDIVGMKAQKNKDPE